MRRAVIVIAVAFGAVATMTAPAVAHAALTSSDPAAGALLEAAPATITLSFTEPPDPELSTVEVLNAGGTAVQTGPTERGAENLLRTSLPGSLPDGVYTVSWRVVSEVDGHLTASAFAFGVNVDPATAPPPALAEASTPGPSPGGVAGRVLLYAGIAILVAAAVVGGLAFGGRLPARRTLMLAASTSLAAGVVVLVLSQASTVGVGVMQLLGSRAGRPYAVLAGVGIATAAAGIEAGFGTGRWALVLAGVGAAAAALVRSVGGHAAAAPPPPLAISVQWIHVLAVSTWIGGLVLLALLARGDDERLATHARRFSLIALIAAPAVVVTGSLRAATELGGISWFLRAFDTSYGTTLAIKVGVVGGLLGLGAFNRLRGVRLLSAGRSTPLQRAVLGELVLAAGVLGLTGTLTSLPPRPEAPTPAAAVAAFARATDFASTVEVRLRASPGRPGPNRFVVRLFEPGSGEPLAADAVSLRFEPLAVSGVAESTLDLASVDGAWTAQGANLSIAGTWEVRTTVLRGAEGVEIPLVLTTVSPPAELTTSETPGLPTLTTATLPDGVSLQAYLDPSVPGTSQAHVTAFDPDGAELPLEAATFVAFAPDSTAASLTPERFGVGHFVATVELVPGRWRFALTATTADGLVLQMPFSRTVGAL